MNRAHFKSLTYVLVLLALGGCTAKPGAQHSASSENVEVILSKYSDQQLQTVLAERRSKALHPDIPAELQNISSGAIVDSIRHRQKSIYGTDRRRDFYEIQDPKELAVANSIAALVAPEHWQETARSYRLVGNPLGEEEKLCSGQNFFDQPEIAYCSGFVIGPDLIATAGHCIRPDLDAIRIVFGYRTIRLGNAYHITTEISKSEVYKPIAVVALQKEPAGLDYAILRVDRPIADHLILPLHTQGTVNNGDEVYVIGHPSGLPMKLVDQGTVRSISNKG